MPTELKTAVENISSQLDDIKNMPQKFLKGRLFSDEVRGKIISFGTAQIGTLLENDIKNLSPLINRGKALGINPSLYLPKSYADLYQNTMGIGVQQTYDPAKVSKDLSSVLGGMAP